MPGRVSVCVGTLPWTHVRTAAHARLGKRTHVSARVLEHMCVARACVLLGSRCSHAMAALDER
eukprot:6185642-Pleurochrysis_carterae.AAC.1